MNQHVQHTRNFNQRIHHTFESSAPQGDPPHHPQLKSALKLPPSNAIDDWAKADHYIRVQVVVLVLAEADLSQKAILLVERINDYFTHHFGAFNHRQHRTRCRQGKFNRAMNKVRGHKNEMRRKYRAALRCSQPSAMETIIQLASAYHHLVREHNRIRRQKESHDLQSRMWKDRRQFANNIWKFASQLLDDDSHTGTSPSFFEADATCFFTETYSSQYQQPFQIPSWMKPCELPVNAFDP